MSHTRSLSNPSSDFIEMVLDTLFQSRPIQEERRHRSRYTLRRRGSVQAKAHRPRKKRAA